MKQNLNILETIHIFHKFMIYFDVLFYNLEECVLLLFYDISTYFVYILYNRFPHCRSLIGLQIPS